MSHLEMHRLRVYVCQAIPDELESLTVREMHDRGSVSVCGRSDVFELSYGERLSVSLGVTGGTSKPQVQSLSWLGDVKYLDFEFDPSEVRSLALERAKAAAVAKEATQAAGGATASGNAMAFVDLHGELQICAEIEDLRSRLKAAGKRGAFGVGGAGTSGSSDRKQVFPCAVVIQEFPPPAEPTDLSLVHRTNAALSVAFVPPKRWGGCALDRFEVQMREIGKDGEYHEKGWVSVQDIPAGRPTVTQIAARIWMAEVRVRSWNIASDEPSAWSEILKVLEPAAGDKAGPSSLDKAGKSKTDVIAEARAKEGATLKKGKSTIEAGVATVMQQVRNPS